MTKSLWNLGFQEIKNFAREQNAGHLKETVLERFRLKFWKRTCGSAFSQWRSGGFALTVTEFEEAHAELVEKTEEHAAK